MADQKVTLETKIKITGVQMAKGLKAGDLKVSIDQAHFKSQIDKIKTKLASAIAGMRVQPQIHITKSALAGLRKQIKEGLQDIQVGVTGRAAGGAAGRVDSRTVGRINTLLSNMGDNIRMINRGLRSLQRRLEQFASIRPPRGGGGGGGGRPPGGGGGGGRGGLPGGGGSSQDFLLLLTQVPRLDSLVKELGGTFRRDLFSSLIETGKAGDEARRRLLGLIQAQQQLTAATGRGPRDPRAVLGLEAQKDLQKELKRTAKIAMETRASLDALKKTGRKFESLKQFKELQREARKLGLTADELAVKVDKVFGAGAGGRGRGVDFGSFFGKSGSFQQFQQVQRVLEKSSAEAAKFSNIIEEVGRKAAVFRIASIAINSMANAIRNAGQFLVEFDGKLRDINKILQLSEAGLNRLGATITKMAGQTGVAAVEIAGVKEELARAGLAGRGFGSITELTDNILTGFQGTTLNATEATEFMIQTIGQLEAGMTGLSKELVTTTKGFDILGKIEDVTASKASDVANAFKRSGASLLSTGATFEEIATLIAVTQERTRRGAEVIGTAFKTLATRISNPVSEASRALRGIGVATVDAQGNLRNIFDVLQDTARAFENLTEAQQASISATVAGVRQVEIFRNVINGASRQMDVLAQAQSASGDAARKQAEEQRKLSVTIDRIGGKFQSLVESARASGLDLFFKSILALVNGLLTGITAVDQALGGAVTGTALAFGLAQGFAFAIKIFRRLAIGFGQFLASLNTVPKTMSAIGTSAASVGQILAATAKATGANVEQTKRWASELERVKMQLQQASTAQTAAGPAAGGRRGIGGKVRGGLEAVGSKLTFTNLLAASLVLEGLEQAAASMNSVLLESVASVGQMAVNGALLGSAFGPAGAAVGGLIGGVTGLISSLQNAESEATKMAELTRIRFEEAGDSVDELEFDTFSAAVGRANKGLAELTRTLDELSPGLIQGRAKGVAEKISSVADDPEFLQLGPQARAKRFNEALSRAIREQFQDIGDFDINKITELTGDLDFEKLKQILTVVLAERLGKPLSEAEKIVNLELLKLEGKARGFEDKAAQIGATIGGELDKFNSGFDAFIGMLGVGESGEIVQSVRELRGFQESLRGQATATRSTGGAARALADLIQRMTVIAEAVEKAEDRAQRLARGGQAARFELQNMFTDFFDLDDILKGVSTKGGGELEDAFKALGTFSVFANTFRSAAAKFLTNAEMLRAATLKASEPLDKMAQLEAQLAEQQLARLRTTTKLTQTAKVISLLDSFEASLGSLGEGKDVFNDFAKEVIGTVEAVGRFGDSDPESAMQALAKAAEEFTKQSKQIDNKEVVSATKKLFSGVTEVFIGSQTAIRNKELELRRKQIAAVKEQFKGIESSAKVLVENAKLEELRNNVLTSQLSGLERIAAEEQALTNATSARAGALRQELAALRAITGTGISGDARSEVNKRIAERERELTKILLDEQRKRGDLERRRVEESVKLAKRDSAFAGDVLKKRTKLNSLLGAEAKGIEKFTRALEQNQKELQVDLRGLQNAIAAVAASAIPAIEKSKKLKELRREVAKRTLEAAVAEAEIITRRKEAVKELVSEGLKTQDELKDAQREVFEKTKEVSEAFNDYVDAVQAVIAATTNYTVGLALANIEAKRLTGSFLGIKDQINAVSKAFRRAEQVALAVGAGEKIIADLRKKSIAEQIRLFNELLTDQQNAARSFFTSSRESQADLFRSLQALKGLVGSGLFGNSFDDFQNMGEDAINAIGAQLLALPQETRQGLIDAISALASLGVGVGGFTAAQLQGILDTVALGASAELDVDPLFEVQSRIADLTEEQARLQLDGIVAANEQVQLAKEQLSEARGARQMAEIQMDRLQQTADRIDSRIANLRGGAGAGVISRGNDIRGAIVEGSRNGAAVSYGSAAATLSTGEGFTRGRGGGSNLRNDGTSKTTNDILRKIEALLNTKLDAQTAELVEIRENQETGAGTAAAGATATATTPLQAEFNVQIDGNQQVRVTGLTEGLNTVIAQIINTFGPFVTEDEARTTILQPILDQINKFFLERGLQVLGFQ